jgi:hypothetical protein
LALNQKEEETSYDPWDKFLVSEVSDSYYAVAEGRNSGSFGIYADVGKFLSEVGGVVGALFKVCPTYPEVMLYLEFHQGWGQRDPTHSRTRPRSDVYGQRWNHDYYSHVGRGRMTFSEKACWIKVVGMYVGTT